MVLMALKYSLATRRVAFLLALLCVPCHQAAAVTRPVPSWYPTIQAAIDDAVNGDVVLLSPGTYSESPVLSGKSLIIASHYYFTGDRSYIGRTIIDGGGSGWVIRFDSTVEPAASIIGLTLRNAEDGLRAVSKVNFLDNRVTNVGDGIDFGDGSGGVVRGCVFENNSDDGIDLDNSSAALIENNIIRNNGDDGIEIRLHPYTGPRLDTSILNNEISGNDEDCIQLIGYQSTTNRLFRIEGNKIVNNTMAGLGIMCCENTIEDYQGASIPERVLVLNNTFVGNNHGITGGDSMVALNNIIVNTTNIALKRVDGGSIAAYNLFFNNGTNFSEANVDTPTTVFGDPLLWPDYRLKAGSPAIDKGTAFYAFNDEVVLSKGKSEYAGSAPDLGFTEFLATASAPGPAPRVGLSEARPNPFKRETHFVLALAEATVADLGIFDLLGRRVANLFQGRLEAGEHPFRWDGTQSDGIRAQDGVYFYRVRTEQATATRKLVLIRVN
jgi:hypothetical protein